MNMEAYNEAMALIQKIDDDAYRAAAIEAVINIRVRNELGYPHPSGDLAMRLRREAMEAA
jgi:hypothetical protein